MLLEAARRAYSATRGMPAAEHAEMGENSPEQILTWYCTFLGQHYQLNKFRRLVILRSHQLFVFLTWAC
jgi:hypothetical protein